MLLKAQKISLYLGWINIFGFLRLSGFRNKNKNKGFFNRALLYKSKAFIWDLDGGDQTCILGQTGIRMSKFIDKNSTAPSFRTTKIRFFQAYEKRWFFKCSSIIVKVSIDFFIEEKNLQLRRNMNSKNNLNENWLHFLKFIVNQDSDARIKINTLTLEVFISQSDPPPKVWCFWWERLWKKVEPIVTVEHEYECQKVSVFWILFAFFWISSI